MSESYKYLQKYETIGENAFNNNTKLTNSNKDIVLIQSSLPDNFAVEDHFHDWLEITYMVEGEQLIKINDKNYLLSTGDFLMIGYNKIHSSVTSRECKKITLQIKRSYLVHHTPQFDPEKIWCNSTTIFDVDEYHRYKALAHDFLILTRRFQDQSDLGQIGFLGAFYNLIYSLMKDFQLKEGPNSKNERGMNETMNQIMSYIHKNYESGISLKELAETFFLSPQYISRLFKEVNNMTFLETLNDVRLAHALYDIVNTDKKLLAICFESGFKNNKSFITAFKNKYGSTPGKYRKMIKK